MAFSLLDIERVISQIRRRLRLLEIQGNTGIIKTGLAADRPASVTLSEGITVAYYATDTKVLSVWNVVSETWNQVVLS